MALKIDQNLLQMHRNAMYYAQDAIIALSNKKVILAIQLYRNAFELEQEVFHVLNSAGESNLETLSIIFQSTVTLGIHARYFQEADLMINNGQQLNIPSQIMEELLELRKKPALKEVNYIIPKLSKELMLISENDVFRIILKNVNKKMSLNIFKDSEQAISYAEKNGLPSVILLQINESISESKALNDVTILIDKYGLQNRVKLILVMDNIPDDFVKDETLEVWASKIFYTPFDPIMLRDSILKYLDGDVKEKRNTISDFSYYHVRTFKIGFLKRMFDIFISLIMIILLAPVFLLISLAIIIETRKLSVLYFSRRAGSCYEIFNLIKFRTMHFSDDKVHKMVDQSNYLNMYTSRTDTPLFKVSNDPRLTKVGAFLRNTSLDELPQLVNVLMGHMSLVGNRPLPLYEASFLITEDWIERFIAPAGFTGLWQVEKQIKKEMTREERLELDVYYSKNRSFLLDFWILLKTIVLWWKLRWKQAFV
jgi:lipopolysaccharide/colanic/teichoic acid biosynthesis glycosyltransferase